MISECIVVRPLLFLLMAQTPAGLLRTGDKVVRINEAISMVEGFGNTYLVNTPEGSVIIDTSIVLHASRHKQLLKPVAGGPIRYIILTHAHQDHTGGIPQWKEAGTQIIAQKNHVEFMHYMSRLAGFYAARNAAQFSLPIPPAPDWAGNYGAKIEPNILFDEKYEFTLGGVKFELYSTPGETYDHLTVWIPQYKAAFTGDNFYTSFPNIYTLRGTQPRWALDYIRSLDKVLELQPDFVLPSHGKPVQGKENVAREVTRYRNAIQYVHDSVVKGMNAGKDVFTLMREIRLPPELAGDESYGKLDWSVRGIYEGYVGWFDGNPSTMYGVPTSAIFADLAKLAGGPEPVARLAAEKVAAGNALEALHLSDVALSADSNHRGALQARLGALEWLRNRCRNSNERGWLDYFIARTKSKLAQKP